MVRIFSKTGRDTLLLKRLIAGIIILGMLLTPRIPFAGNVEMTALGEYVMGDNDTYTEAKKLALQDAKRIILEKIGTYIESKTEVKNGVFSSDEIKQYSAGLIKVEEIGEERSLLANKALLVKVNIRAALDPDALIGQILSFRSRQDIEESARKLSVDNAKLRQEINLINQQLHNAVEGNEYKPLRAQREEILKKIDANEHGLTMILSGRNLYTAALLDRQRKERADTIVRRFLKALPAAYSLSVSPPEVEDNGRGKATVVLKVSYQLPIVTSNYLSNNISGISGLDLNELRSTGLAVRRGAGYSRGTGITIYCDENTCEGALGLLLRELKAKPLVLYVTLGPYRMKREISDCTDRYDRPFLQSNATEKFTIKIPLNELKSLSGLKAKVIYTAGK
jgi:hypothetical protein